MIKKLSLILLTLTCFSSEVKLFSMANFTNFTGIIASTTPLMQAAQAGNTSGVTQLIQSGVDIDATDSYGRTALMYAIQPHSNINNFKVVQILIQNKAKINYIAGGVSPYALANLYAGMYSCGACAQIAQYLYSMGGR